MAMVGNILIGIEADPSGVKPGLDKARKQVAGFGASLGPLLSGVAGRALGGLTIGAAVVKAAGAASDLNEQLSAAGVVFGPQARLVTDAAQEMADKFGVVKSQFIEAANAMGGVFSASGLKDEAAGMSVQFTKLALDLSSIRNVPVDEALRAIQSGLVGEAEPLRRFGVLLSDASMKAKAMAMGIGGANGTLTEAQKVQARAAIITEQLAYANGDLARTFGGVANRARGIWGNLKNGLADIGAEFEPLTQQVLDFASVALNGMLVPALKGVAWVLGGIGEGIRLFREGLDITFNGYEAVAARQAAAAQAQEAAQARVTQEITRKTAAENAAAAASKRAADAAAAQAEAVKAQAEAIQQGWQRATDDAKALIDATTTPAERLEAELQKIGELERLGLIDRTTAARGILAAEAERNRSAGKDQLGGALAAGSAEARSALLAASTQATAQNKADEPLRQVAGYTRDQLQLERELNAIMTRVESTLKQAIQPAAAVSL